MRDGSGTSIRVIAPLRDFLALETASAILIVAATIWALVWRNGPWTTYETFWQTKASIRVGSAGLSLDLRHWVNEALMALFFFVAALEIKRELVEGELQDRKRALLPVCAAVGGMVVPTLLFLGVIGGGAARRGWGIPMATDIAMALAAITLLGNRVPSRLKLFVLALAIVDDIGAIVVIAFVYSTGIKWEWLVVAAATVAALFILRRRGSSSAIGLLSGGVLLWLALHEAGVHATIAGVIFGALTPARPVLSADLVDQSELVDLSTLAAAETTVRLARSTVSELERLEHRFHPWTSYAILPVFALANAGVSLKGSDLEAALRQPLMWSVAIGLVVGKPLGIVLATWIAVRFRIASLPEGVRWSELFGVATLCGIGFTVSIFISDRAFTSERLQSAATIGILLGTLSAAVLGAVILSFPGRKGRRRRSQPTASQIIKASTEPAD